MFKFYFASIISVRSTPFWVKERIRRHTSGLLDPDPQHCLEVLGYELSWLKNYRDRRHERWRRKKHIFFCLAVFSMAGLFFAGKAGADAEWIEKTSGNFTINGTILIVYNVIFESHRMFLLDKTLKNWECSLFEAWRLVPLLVGTGRNC